MVRILHLHRLVRNVRRLWRHLCIKRDWWLWFRHLFSFWKVLNLPLPHDALLQFFQSLLSFPETRARLSCFTALRKQSLVESGNTLLVMLTKHLLLLQRCSKA